MSTKSADELDDLARRLEDTPPEALVLEEGQSFIGSFVRLDRGFSSYGERWIVVMADENGEEHGLWLHHAALLSQFKKAKPQPGERVGVKNLGERASVGGKSRYIDWRVVTGRTFDWTDVAGNSDGWDSEPPPF